MKWTARWAIELALRDLDALRSIPGGAAQEPWMSKYEKLLQEKLRRHADVLRAWLAASSQASSSLPQIKLDPDADTPPPPRTAEKVDELKSAVDLAICDLAALESIMLPAPGWP